MVSYRCVWRGTLRGREGWRLCVHYVNIPPGSCPLVGDRRDSWQPLRGLCLLSNNCVCVCVSGECGWVNLMLWETLKDPSELFVLRTRALHGDKHPPRATLSPPGPLSMTVTSNSTHWQLPSKQAPICILALLCSLTTIRSPVLQLFFAGFSWFRGRRKLLKAQAY